MERIVVNLAGSSRSEILNGRHYSVVPMTMIVEGVLPGSRGSLFYPADEIDKTVDAWANMPITNGHPRKNDNFCSASSSGIKETYHIGFVSSPTFNQSKLKAEAWIDVEKCKTINHQILNSIDAGRPVELSTGLFADYIEPGENAVFNGRSYDAVAVNHRPDHLAILTNEKGACSIADGCGVLVTNKDGKEVNVNFHLTTNEMSHSELHDMLWSALRSKFTQSDPDVWIREVFDDFLVYEQEGLMYKQRYTKSNTGVDLSSDSPQRVMRETNFVPVTNAEENNPMVDKSKLIEAIIANDNSVFGVESREFLTSMPEDKLTTLAGQSKPLTANGSEGKVEPTTPASTEPEPVANGCGCNKSEAAKPLTVNELQEALSGMSEGQWLEIMPNGLRDVVTNAAKIEATDKERIMGVLTANMNDEAKTAFINQYKDASLDVLQGMEFVANSHSSKPVESAPQPALARPSYFGAGGVSNTQPVEVDDEPLTVPTMNFNNNN